MPQDLLNESDVNTVFKKMGGVGMTKGMNRGIFLNTALKKGIFESLLNGGSGDGMEAFL